MLSDSNGGVHYLVLKRNTQHTWCLGTYTTVDWVADRSAWIRGAAPGHAGSLSSPLWFPWPRQSDRQSNPLSCICLDTQYIMEVTWCLVANLGHSWRLPAELQILIFGTFFVEVELSCWLRIISSSQQISDSVNPPSSWGYPEKESR